jgi:hypothetical protein
MINDGSMARGPSSLRVLDYGWAANRQPPTTQQPAGRLQAVTAESCKQSLPPAPKR